MRTEYRRQSKNQRAQKFILLLNAGTPGINQTNFVCLSAVPNNARLESAYLKVTTFKASLLLIAP